MLHKDVLRLLFPLELTGDFDPDIEIEGKHLDDAQARAEDILKEMFPDQSSELLPHWERVCGFVTDTDEPLQKRRDRVINKLRELGGLSIPYFVSLAAALGYVITIEELTPFRVGVGRCGDRIYLHEVIFIWRVKTEGMSPLYYFRAGQSASGERLLWWTVDIQEELEGLIKELKPAHTYAIFEYT